MIHTAWIVTSCILKIFLGERGLLCNGSLPIYPFLVMSLISNKLGMLMKRLVYSINVLKSYIRSLIIPEVLAMTAIGLETIMHRAFLAVAAIPMRRSLRGSWRCWWRRHVVWRSW